MPPVQVPFPTSSAKGKFAESGGRLVNAFAEKLADGRVKISRPPGVRSIIEVEGRSHCRGAIEINGVALEALNDRLGTITLIGGNYVPNDLGAFAGSETVYFARNNKSPTPDIVAVTDSTAFVVDMSTGASSYPDPDVGSPNSVCFLGGYFIFSYGNSRMRASGLNDTSINTLDTAFAESKPDGLLRVIALGKNLYACGPQTIEIWPNTGNATGFPFSYLDTIPRGIAGPDAIAGFENDWSNAIIFAGGDNVVYRINGNIAEPVSNPSVSKDLERLTDKSGLRAVVYGHEGHAVWALSCDDWTWCYDLATGSWFERASYDRKIWRASACVKCFGSWVVGDDQTGKFGMIDPDYGYEFGDPLIFDAISSTMSGFPARASMPRLDLDIMSGVGTAPGQEPIETNPLVSVSWSRDGGVTFGSPVVREIGAQGKYEQGIRVNRLGTASAKGAQIRVQCSDPRPITLFGGTLQVEAKG
ncbi:packaged DNA stabilization protein [Bosea sp. (in: a-proteobacteria)]|uniref:packaged DNA stabilization protein n=1 Tax=Bosea sp. (in: a-proteobacteria) TaxID=1871050 RepID=UPI002628810F|nr:packaged DNA stabilization protein [Bosea sp. (in: a-proteobacteria)]MCO5092659.1 packaged DNA stabilization protein gp10 [Bosea sp. (in: a-proteobacteria)]